MRPAEIIVQIAVAKSRIDLRQCDSITDACLDSLQSLELQSEVENRFKVKMDRGLTDIETFDEWGQYIEKLCSKAKSTV
jgi:acyl carrier protein